ncbi:VacJ family lipoprotein [Thermodesulfobacteriota bacterium]
MKKIYCLVLFSLLWFIQTSSFSFAGPSGASPGQTGHFKGQSAQAAQLELAPDIEVISDNFGGYLYFFRDMQGNRCATNSMDLIIGSNKAVKPESVSPDNIPDQVIEEGPMEIAKLKEIPDESSENSETDDTAVSISDPLEPINRIFFHFNDKLYFWFLKPLATGYKALVPEPARVSVKNFFDNLAFPVRFVNCLLQGKFKGAENELGRFLMNSTFGAAGFFDLAKTHYSNKTYDEDLGQTLGSYGTGPGFFINWPVFGPSSVRDTFGLVGDSFLNPINWEVDRTKYNIAVKGFKTGNKTSFIIGEYEDLKKAALDPYVSIRDAYFQYRRNKIKE